MKRLLMEQSSKQNLIDEEPHNSSHKNSFIKIQSSENRRTTFKPYLLPVNKYFFKNNILILPL
jgi:hypothetical protein